MYFLIEYNIYAGGTYKVGKEYLSSLPNESIRNRTLGRAAGQCLYLDGSVLHGTTLFSSLE